MIALLIVISLLGGLYYVLQGTAGAAFGGQKTTQMAIIGAIGLIIMVLIAFLLLPELGEILKQNTPVPPFDGIGGYSSGTQAVVSTPVP